MDPELLARIIEDVREQFVREMEQGVLKHDLYQSTAALGGKDACDRIARAIALRTPRPVERIDGAKKRA